MKCVPTQNRIIRLIILSLFVLFVVMSINTISYADTSGTCGKNLRWTLNNAGKLTIYGQGEMQDFELRDIPWQSSSVSSVVITHGATSIGGMAFFRCTNLTSITIPDSVTSIGYSAFEGCRGLTSITIPDSVTFIGWRAFEGCRGLTSITIPDSVTYIDGYAFSECSGLTSITIPDSVTSIEGPSSWTGQGGGEVIAGAFEGCTGLTSITIPDSVTSIGGYAFYGCSGLTSITIPDSVNNIGVGAFSGCSGLTSITIPDSVTSIGGPSSDGWTGEVIAGAFEGCTGLTSITIPDSVTSIGGYAFSRCSGLTDIYFTGDAPKMYDAVFSRITTTAHYPADNPTYTDEVKQDYGGKVTWVPTSSTQQDSISATVTFKVVNGAWDDGSTAEKTVTLSGYDGDTLKLSPEQIPAVGSKPGTNYKAGSWDVTPSTSVEIEKDTTYTYTYADKTAPEITAPTAKTLTYNGTAQQLITAGSAVNGTMLYALGNVNEATQDYSPSIPEGINAGTYYVWYMAKGDETHSNTNPACVPVVIGKANLTVTVSGYSGVYDGKAHSITVDVEGTNAVVYYATTALTGDNYLTAGVTTTPPAYENVGIVTVYYYVVSGNYNPVAGSNTIHIIPASSPAPEDLSTDERPVPKANLEENGTAQQLVTAPKKLPDGYTKVQYSLDGGKTWTDDVPVESNAGNYNILVQYIGDDNHNDFIGSPITVQIKPKSGTDPEISPLEAYVRRCYKIIMEREGDAEGVQFWITTLKSGSAAGADIVSLFCSSNEFHNRNLNHSRIAEILYNTMMGRQPDAGGLSFWTGLLDNGTSVDSIIAGFASSEEFARICAEYGITPVFPAEPEVNPLDAYIRRCYTLILQREGEAEGVQYWTEALRFGYATGADIVLLFCSSDEFQSRNLDNRHIAEILYNTMMGRQPDAGGLAFWTGLLDSGIPIETIISGFASSAEFAGICEEYGIIPTLTAEESETLNAEQDLFITEEILEPEFIAEPEQEVSLEPETILEIVPELGDELEPVPPFKLEIENEEEFVLEIDTEL